MTQGVAPVDFRSTTVVAPAPGASPPPLRADGGAGLTIGLLAHVGMHNLGDEIMFAATLEYYRARLPRARFVAFTMNPTDTKHRYDLKTVHPIRPPRLSPDKAPAGGRLRAYLRTIAAVGRGLAREVRFAVRGVRQLRGLDFVVVTGSSQFIDAYGGPTGFPAALLRWTVLARVARVPICFLSLGAESLGHSWSRWMVRRTVHLANFITLRDAVSRDRLAAQGVRRQIELAPDLSLAYPWNVSHSEGLAEETRLGTVGINPIPYYHSVFWRAVDEDRYGRYLAAMIDLTVTLLRRGHRIVLYGTTHWADQVPAQDIQAAVLERLGREGAARLELAEVHTLEDLRSTLDGVDWVVASRYHGVATALLMQRPAIGIAYEPKTADLMTNLGLDGFSIPIDDIDGDQLVALLERLQREHEGLSATLAARVREGRETVGAQFDEIVALYGSTRVEN